MIRKLYFKSFNYGDDDAKRQDHVEVEPYTFSNLHLLPFESPQCHSYPEPRMPSPGTGGLANP